MTTFQMIRQEKEDWLSFPVSKVAADEGEWESAAFCDACDSLTTFSEGYSLSGGDEQVFMQCDNCNARMDRRDIQMVFPEMRKPAGKVVSIRREERAA